MDRDLIEYLPNFLKDYREFKAIASSEQIQFGKLENSMEKVLNNMFICDADECSISRYESFLKITANKPTETLEFRRERILNRMLLLPPFTLRFLKNKLNEIIGEDKYSINMDYANYTLYIESSGVNQNWYEEISFTINKIKPCNIIFINKPLNYETIKISQESTYNKILYNYRLGFWKLGSGCFGSLDKTKNAESGEKQMITDYLFEKLSDQILSRTTRVLLNDKVEIQDFTIKEVQAQANGANAVVEYRVTKALLNEPITNVKLITWYSSTDFKAISNANVYIPILDDTLVKHTIKLERM